MMSKASLTFSMLAAAAIADGEVRILKFSEAKQFRMGRVTSNRIVHPDMGAKRLTLNYSLSEPGDEFAQHTHGDSDDTILILRGQADMRQGDTRRGFVAGQCAFVPGGQIHGTITTGNSTAEMISFQTPPDMALYTGARDSSKPGAAAPKGLITPGAIRYVDFAKGNGFFVDPGMGANRIAAAYRKLKPGEKFAAKADADGEQVLFVWRGGIEVKGSAGNEKASERDAVFLRGPAEVEVVNNGTVEAVVIQAQAPPQPAWKNQ
jgi:quercetin dioxygenase-like cupin family protein